MKRFVAVAVNKKSRLRRVSLLSLWGEESKGLCA